MSTLRRPAPLLAPALAAALMLAWGPHALPVKAQALYRYKDADGNWQFSDRPPPDGEVLSREPLPLGDREPEVKLEPVREPPGLRVVNGYHMPVQLTLRLEGAGGGGGRAIERVVGARQTLEIGLGDVRGELRLRHALVLGDPEARHAPDRPYRVPFSVASRFQVTQAFGDRITHDDAASLHAVDIAMPVGTAIVAARSGIVVETAYTHYGGGTDRERDGPRANVVRILHADGTHAIYAHLDRASVTVRPGDRVRRGQRIAASGNSGFSTGPHLHFAVLRNAGMRTESVPFEFAGPDGRGVVPRRGEWLTAYP